MPDNNGIYTLVPGYLAQAGQTIKVSQHNPVLEDIADAFNRRLMRDGTTPMNDDLPMGGNKITGLADPAAAQDAATKGYVDGAVSGLSSSLGTAAVVDHGTAPGEVPLNSDLGTMATETATDYVPQSDKASTLEAQAGVNDTKWMTPARVADVALGVGQTWVDVTASRASDTSYQNTSGRPIMVSVASETYSTVSSKKVQVSSDGVNWLTLTYIAQNISGARLIGSPFVVPTGWYYRLVTGDSFNYWSELR